jgi:hypothetical protein
MQHATRRVVGNWHSPHGELMLSWPDRLLVDRLLS